jgi:hypothetical protein
MAIPVYVLCALTSAGCAALLARQYFRTGGALLFWSTACFLCLAVSNLLLFIDLAVVPTKDLSLARTCISFTGLAALLYGLIREST